MQRQTTYEACHYPPDHMLELLHGSFTQWLPSSGLFRAHTVCSNGSGDVWQLWIFFSSSLSDLRGVSSDDTMWKHRVNQVPSGKFRILTASGRRKLAHVHSSLTGTAQQDKSSLPSPASHLVALHHISKERKGRDNVYNSLKRFYTL